MSCVASSLSQVARWTWPSRLVLDCRFTLFDLLCRFCLSPRRPFSGPVQGRFKQQWHQHKQQVFGCHPCRFNSLTRTRLCRDSKSAHIHTTPHPYVIIASPQIQVWRGSVAPPTCRLSLDEACLDGVGVLTVRRFVFRDMLKFTSANISSHPSILAGSFFEMHFENGFGFREPQPFILLFFTPPSCFLASSAVLRGCSGSFLSARDAHLQFTG